MPAIYSIFEDLKIELAKIQVNLQTELANSKANTDARIDEIDARIAKLESEADPAEVARVKAIEAQGEAMTDDEVMSFKMPSNDMFTCECGSVLQNKNKQRHFTTKKHLQYVESL